MAKSSKDEIEKGMQNVIYELEKNSDRSVNELANKLGFSRQKIWRIIKDLENDNTIWGYTAIVDDNKIGRKRFFILLKKAHIPVKEEKLDIVVNREFVQIAKKFGVQLESTYFLHGSYDGLLCVTADDIAKVKNFIDKINKKLDGIYISDANILEVLFPVARNGFSNPNVKEFKEFFLKD